MAHLVNCFECRAQVSSEIYECPKCKNPVRGYHCRICCISDKKVNLPLYFCHEKCAKKVKKEYDSFHYSCPACSYSDKSLADAKQCPECAHPFKGSFDTVYCTICGLPLVRIAGIYRSSAFTEFDGWRHNYCYSKHYGSCFLATALYGEDSSKVQMLCFFRDEYLAASSLGRAFIALYVRLSPPLARAITKESLLRSLVRSCIVAPALLFTEKFLAYAGRKGNFKI